MIRSLSSICILVLLAGTNCHAEVRGVSIPISCEDAGKRELLNGSILLDKIDLAGEMSFHYRGSFNGSDATIVHKCSSGDLEVQSIKMTFTGKEAARSKYLEISRSFEQSLVGYSEDPMADDVDFMIARTWRNEAHSVSILLLDMESYLTVSIQQRASN